MRQSGRPRPGRVLRSETRQRPPRPQHNAGSQRPRRRAVNVAVLDAHSLRPERRSGTQSRGVIGQINQVKDQCKEIGFGPCAAKK
jgi:phage tail tape-measure protein